MKNKSSIVIVLITIIVLLILFIVIRKTNQFGLVSNTIPTPTSTPTLPTDKTKPAIASPLPNSKISSPLKVTGSVPPGWMFEGQLIIKLLDSSRNVITQAAGQEAIPGCWQTGEACEFESTLIFTTNSKSGFILVEKDNPSGLPENAGEFEIPVVF